MWAVEFISHFKNFWIVIMLVTLLLQLNQLLYFHENRFRSSIQKLVTKAWISWMSLQRSSFTYGLKWFCVYFPHFWLVWAKFDIGDLLMGFMKIGAMMSILCWGVWNFAHIFYICYLIWKKSVWAVPKKLYQVVVKTTLYLGVWMKLCSYFPHCA